MAKIKIQDYIRDVELNRQRLISSIKKQSPINDNISLGETVTKVTNIINNIESPVENKYRVRWININGDLIRTDYVEAGTNVTPPDPAIFNCDPDYLEFDDWTTTSDITNVQKDIDCGTIYKTKADSDGRRWTYIFCNLASSIGLTVTIPYNKRNNAAIMLIDWGDGSELEQLPTDSYIGLVSHTYQEDDHYVIKVWCDYNGWVFNTEPPNYLLGARDLTDCVYKMFLGDNISSSKRLQLDSSALKYVSIPNSSTITSFTSEFFNNNNSLECIIFPKNITSTDNFWGYSLKYIVLNQKLKSLPSYFLAYMNAALSLILPDGLATIYNSMLTQSNGNGTRLTEKLTIPATVTELGNSALAYSVIPEIIFEVPSSLSIIGNNAFTRCSGLTTFDLTQFSNLTSVKSYAFNSTDIEVMQVKPGIVLEQAAFGNMYRLKELILYDNFDMPLGLSSYNLSLNTLYNIANWLKDNTGLTAKQFVFSKYTKVVLQTNYINVQGLPANKSDAGAVSLFDYIRNKNWTISFYS